LHILSSFKNCAVYLNKGVTERLRGNILNAWMGREAASIAA